MLVKFLRSFLLQDGAWLAPTEALMLGRFLFRHEKVCFLFLTITFLGFIQLQVEAASSPQLGFPEPLGNSPVGVAFFP